MTVAYIRTMAVLVIVGAAAACSDPEPTPPTVPAEAADLVLINGGIYTVNAKQPWAQGMAVRDDTIIAVGGNEDVEPLIAETTRVVDLAGKMALPGFHDAHVHPTMGGQALLGCNLADVFSVEEILATVRGCVEEGGEGWLEGHAFDLSLFGQNGPDKALLDEISTARPIVLWASDGHNAWANSLALELAGITAESEDPQLGVIERRPDGTPAGTLRETAQEIVRDAMPPPTDASNRRALEAGIRHLNAFGVTSWVDAWVGEGDYRSYHAIDRDGGLSARVRTSLTYESGFAYHTGEEFERVLAGREAYESDRLNHDSIKLFLDGVLEGETAALLEPYTGLHHRGELILDPESLNAAVTRFDEMGMQVHMHAIGDRAVRAGLDAVEAARRANGERDNRHHISHLQLVHVDDIERFGELNTAANFQALWALPDRWIMELNLPVLGEERVQGMYPIGGVARAGGRIVGGSDWNVSSANPLEAIEVALRRQDPETPDGPVLNENQRVDLQTMIEAYTINGAWLMHQEQLTGSIEPGKRADLVILDRNLFEIPVSEINEARVLATLLDGEYIFEATDESEKETL